MISNKPISAVPFSADGAPNLVESFELVSSFGFAAFSAGPFCGDVVAELSSPKVQAANIWDTDQGVAKGYAKFTPTQQGEARFVEVGIAASHQSVSPTADSEVIPDTLTASFGFFNQFNLTANGYAPIHSRAGFVGYFKVEPTADSIIKTHTTPVAHRFAKVTPTATASPVFGATPAMTAESGYTFPWGVRNPSDEEIITIILEARKRRVLTQNKTNGITRA